MFIVASSQCTCSQAKSSLPQRQTLDAYSIRISFALSKSSVQYDRGSEVSSHSTETQIFYVIFIPNRHHELAKHPSGFGHS